jgi:hypothetical protein
MVFIEERNGGFALATRAADKKKRPSGGDDT